ncbi:unnamed protein product [Rotaria magnacalcarata]
MNDVYSKYKPIHRRDLTRSFLPALHKKCTSKLQEICAEATHVSLTLDIWCDRRMRSYFGVKFNYTIPRANRTRWNNQFQTVKKVIDIPSSILNLILSDLKKNDLILNSKDRKVLEEFVSLFELFNEATVLTQGESYATICLVAPTVLGILFDLERELGSSTLTLVSLCEALIASIKARFSGLLRYFEIDVPFNTYCMSERFSDVIFLISPLLDARFKLL